MLIRVPPRHSVKSSEITPEAVYRDRRRFLAQTATAFAGLALAGCGHAAESGASQAPAGATPAAAPTAGGGYSTDPAKLGSLAFSKKTEMAGGEKITPIKTVTDYNNFYEFGTGKSDPAEYADTLQPLPWQISVGGECEKPGVLSLEDFTKPNTIEERIYRHRCVEAWSIVVPWVGFSLADALKHFKPTSKARYVAFRSLYDPKQMPEAGGVLPWPYREGLRIDEAMHPLSFMTTGMYGKLLPKQDGAPIRLTVPWKYGFKSIKCIVAIDFVEQMPETTWNHVGPDEYGFYANVNPNVPHPRWSQAHERRLGDLFMRKTLMFNGYDEVASLYSGMDLHKYF